MPMFFLLTGFKLCLSYHRREVSLCKFYLKRWMSIVPLYYLAICIGFILTRIYDSPNCPTFLIGCWRQNTDVKAILANILLIHNLFINGNNDVVGGGWYIGVTFLFYILFPLFVSFFDYIHKRFHSLTMFLPFLFWGCMVFIRNICIISGVSEFINCGYMFFFEQAPCILLGMLLYYQYADGELDFNIKEKGKLAFLLIILLILFLLNVINYKLRWVNVSIFFTGLYYCCFMFLHAIQDFIKNNWIFKAISKVGKVSYALLFVHVFIFYEFVPVIYRILPFQINVNVFWLCSFIILLVPMYYISYVLTAFSNRLKIN